MVKVLLQKFQSQYDWIDNLLEGVPASILMERFQPDQWSIHENLAHLGRYQEIFETRITNVILQERATFERYKAENDIVFPIWVQKSTSSIIQETKAKRKEITYQLSQLTSEDWQKIGTHPKLGKLTLRNWVTFFLLHENHHFYTIFRRLHENT